MGRADPVAALQGAVVTAAAVVRGGALDGSPAATPKLERPKRAGQGDYATNVAMLLAPALQAPPREVAERVGIALDAELGADIAGYQVAGPGFVNVTMSDGWYRRSVRWVLEAGAEFGGGGASSPERILLEFVSANPTGPVVAANGQSAAYGDALARILGHAGHQVWREYYFNDAGGQIDRLGESVLARARGVPVPEDGYQGEYVTSLAAAIPGVDSMSAADAGQAAVARLLGQIQATLERYGVHYDRFFSERTVHDGSPSYVERALAIVADGGHSYESDGALWLRSTSFGDEKDRVLRRSDGAPTYLAADLGYLLEKIERGYDRQIIPVGADHHGYVARMKAAFAALGGDSDRLEMPILQFVHLVEGSGRTAMSKRRGEFITLDDLVDEIGVDVTRFFMLQRSHDRTVDLDLDLARTQSSENPVYYIQYAHARICSVLERVGADRVAAAVAESADWGSGGGPLRDDALRDDPEGGSLREDAGGGPAATPLHASERELVKTLLELPREIAEAADRRAPHRIAAYALELAQAFTAFYRDCKVVGVEPEALESWRIAVCVATRGVLALVLGLLGVSAPEEM